MKIQILLHGKWTETIETLNVVMNSQGLLHLQLIHVFFKFIS